MTRALVLLACSALLAGCPSKKAEPLAPCAAGLPALVEVRDGSGALTVALKRSPPGATPTPSPSIDLCDPNAHKLGAYKSANARGLGFFDQQGMLAFALTVDGPDDVRVTDSKAPHLRVHREPAETRVLKPDGIPIGSLAPRDKGAVVLAPSSVPTGTVAPRDKDMVLAGTDGATRMYVVPASDPVAAGFFAFDALPLPERGILYLWATKTSPLKP